MCVCVCVCVCECGGGVWRIVEFPLVPCVGCFKASACTPAAKSAGEACALLWLCYSEKGPKLALLTENGAHLRVPAWGLCDAGSVPAWRPPVGELGGLLCIPFWPVTVNLKICKTGLHADTPKTTSNRQRRRAHDGPQPPLQHTHTDSPPVNT